MKVCCLLLVLSPVSGFSLLQAVNFATPGSKQSYFSASLSSPAANFPARLPLSSLSSAATVDTTAPSSPSTSSPSRRSPLLYSNFMKIAAPALIQLTAEPLAALVDTAYLGRLGSATLGGAGVAISAHYALGKLYNDPLLKTSVSLVATADADPSASESSKSTAVSAALFLAGFIGVFQLLFYYFLAPQILTSMSLSPSSPMYSSALSYLKYRALGSPAATLWLVANGIFRGLGDTRTPLAFALAFTALNAVLDPLFIFTFKMGAGGAALGTALAQYSVLVPLLYSLHKRVALNNLLATKESRSSLLTSLKSYLSAGSSVCVRTLGKVGCYAYTGRAAALLGPVAAAAYNLTFQLGFATTQICESVAVAVQAMLAREFALLKAANKNDARAAGEARANGRALVKFSVLVGGSIAVALSLATYALESRILAFLTSDPAIRSAASAIFPLVLATQVLKGLAYPANGIIMGGCDWNFSMAAMWASNVLCLTYLKQTLKTTGMPLTLDSIWKGLAIFMATQVAASVLRVASMTGPWRVLRGAATKSNTKSKRPSSLPVATPMVPPPPSRRVAVVTGGSRGIGKGIAVELGRAGFEVHVLGRSTRTAPNGGGAGMGEYRRLPVDEELTVERTAEQVTDAGGVGVAHVTDVSVDSDLQSTITSIAGTAGRLDVLVCSAYEVPSQKLRDDFWKQGMSMWDAVTGVGLRSVYASCLAAVPSMISTAETLPPKAPPPLIVLVSSFGGKSYTFNVAYGVGKAAIDRLSTDMSCQLSRQHGVMTTTLCETSGRACFGFVAVPFL